VQETHCVGGSLAHNCLCWLLCQESVPPSFPALHGRTML
jgi:hypothetical protein